MAAAAPSYGHVSGSRTTAASQYYASSGPWQQGNVACPREHDSRHVHSRRKRPRHGNMNMSPEKYLRQILESRGYPTDMISATCALSSSSQPTLEQMKDYDLSLVTAVRRGDVSVVAQLASQGKRMDACNKHGESIVHIACRRGNVELLRLLLDKGASLSMCDDQGKTPLHDACWCLCPSFDCVTIILEHNVDLVRMTDNRGASPLAYIRPDAWPMWTRFLDTVKDKFWPNKIHMMADTNTALMVVTPSTSTSSGLDSMALVTDRDESFDTDDDDYDSDDDSDSDYDSEDEEWVIGLGR